VNHYLNVTVRVSGMLRGMALLWAVKLACRVVGLDVTQANISQSQ
jgi:hypothetical protein